MPRLQEMSPGGIGLAMPAAGAGRRMGGLRKTFLELRGEPILLHALRPFLEHPAFQAFVVALGEEDFRSPPAWIHEVDSRVRLVRGGATRGDSVWAAVEAMPGGIELVAIHDAARPLVSREIIDRCLDGTGPGRGSVAGLPAVDTLKRVGEGNRIAGTVAREAIWHAQTPQVFPAGLIRQAYRAARRDGVTDTDDSALVERIGGEVVMVRGAVTNLKVTRPQDLVLAELFLEDGS